MTKTIIVFYLVMFGIYVFFSRQPDWLDSELYPAKIINLKEGISQPKAMFLYNNKAYYVDANYPLRNLEGGAAVQVIFEYNNPRSAKFYSWWGYWIKWEELIASIVLCIVLFQVAVVVNINPDEEAKKRDLARIPEVKRKYD